MVIVDDGREKRERVERGVWSVDSIFIFTSKVCVNECERKEDITILAQLSLQTSMKLSYCRKILDHCCY